MSNVITLGSIEMYGLVTVWTSMDDGPSWVILLMYGSHDMRHTGFRMLTVVNRTPGFWGVTTCLLLICFLPLSYLKLGFPPSKSMIHGLLGLPLRFPLIV